LKFSNPQVKKCHLYCTSAKETDKHILNLNTCGTVKSFEGWIKNKLSFFKSV